MFNEDLGSPLNEESEDDEEQRNREVRIYFRNLIPANCIVLDYSFN